MPLLFGPVLSRRLGRSLGLDLVPKKICSMDCLYCEVGKTTLLTLERKDYIGWESIESAIREAKNKVKTFDVLTITGSGEPTLCLYFEKTVEFAKKMIIKPICVLTNSTTVMLPSVQEALAKVDLVLASLDSARKESFKLLNRPALGVSLEEIIKGLKDLREIMEGELWLEILLVKGINDKPEDLEALRWAINYISPHKVQLNTVVRPPAYPIARPLSYEEMVKVKEFLGEKAEIISSKLPKSDLISPKEQVEISIEEKEQLLLEYLKRRPAPLSELTSLFFFERELQELLEKMVESGKIRKVHHQGKIFYTAAKENSEN
ncbi:MAG: radical SAM protein [Caldimicrobium sp.]